MDDGWLALCDVVVYEGGPALAVIAAEPRRPPDHRRHLALLLRGQVRHLSVGEDRSPNRPRTRSPRPVPSSPPGVPCTRPDRARRRPLRSSATAPPAAHHADSAQRLNAVDAFDRDELVEALTLAWPTRSSRGSSCVARARRSVPGGDLDGSACARIRRARTCIRWSAAPAAMLPRPPRKTVTYVDGATVGSGIELAAFTCTGGGGADTQIALPEIGLGLVPGAGGTVSLPLTDRAAAHRRLAFSGVSSTPRTARDWGLVDERCHSLSSPQSMRPHGVGGRGHARDDRGRVAEGNPLFDGDGGATRHGDDGRRQDTSLYALAYTMPGGSNQIMRNIIAERGLGLPWEPKGGSKGQT